MRLGCRFWRIGHPRRFLSCACLFLVNWTCDVDEGLATCPILPIRSPKGLLACIGCPFLQNRTSGEKLSVRTSATAPSPFRSPVSSAYPAKLRLRFYASDHERQIAGAWPLQWLEDNAVIRVDVGRHHAHLVGDRWQPAHTWYLHSHRTWLNVRILLVFRQTRDRIHACAGSQRAGSAGTVQNRARTVGEGGQAYATYLYRPNHESQCVRNGTQ